ncbi:Nicotianamine synthase [Hibiscus syriacus]|uniref:Nicotianamine synthase n=1 Tax=Hibiscus syriacus TaxID=106335 RepID=A0A6A2WXI1_HIBSY|nr:nicotianamine synthase-like [Hibiscus syriacus]KAE8660190.1 Nicotianamine synthase [Hibiscus syriacus]
MVCEKNPLVRKIRELYEQIASLSSLKPSEDVNAFFTQLVVTCIPPSRIDVTKLCKDVQDMRSKLIRLCGEAEGHLENHFSAILASYENPLHHLDVFPYYSNYLKLSQLEFDILTKHCPSVPNKVAFVGSGPLPLTSIVLASFHLKSTIFDNYDIDPLANSKAIQLVSSDLDLSGRMSFHTTDIINVTHALKEYDVVFLAALVGMDKDEKVRVIDHLAKYMSPGAVLMLRSAHGARTFLYPVVDPCDLRRFDVLSIFHPTDEVINSVVIARKSPSDKQSTGQQPLGPMKLPNKFFDIEMFNPLLNHVNLMDELDIEDQIS